MTDPTCPVCDSALPPYTRGRPWVYCSADCRRTMAYWRRVLPDEQQRVADKEAHARAQPTKELRAYHRKYAKKARAKLTDTEQRIARADALAEPRA